MLKSLFSSRSWYSLKTVGFCVILFFGAQFIALSVLYGLLSAIGKSASEITTLFEINYAYTLLYSLVVAGLVLSGVFWLLRKKSKNILDYLLLRKKIGLREIGTVIAVYVAYFMVLLLATTLVSMLSSVDVNQQQELGFTAPKTTLDYLQVYVIIAIIPPVLEEILFRGFLFRTLKRRLSLPWSMAITCVLFGVAHLEYDNLNWIAAIDTLLFSGFLIYLVEKQKSLYGAMLLHCLKNSIAFYVLFVHK